ncbi:MAG: NAD-dependent epimerase/dehydratase family protein [Halieaceae bacterium]|nr:NAD-dependent epimerase/dehydratase family protein [Halieaceae bacterium]
MKCLVTGASGFVGSSLVNELLNLGFEVVAVSKSGGFTSKGQVIHSIDFVCETIPRSLFSNVDIVYHLAGIAHQRAAEEEYEQINFAATIKLAEQACSCAVPKFVFLSSVNANRRSDDFTKPVDPYADSKKRAENELEKQFFYSNMAVEIVRSALVYGKGMKGNLPGLIRAVKRGLPRPPNIGARNMIWLDDLVSFLILVGSEPGDSVRKFVVTDGEVYSLSRIYDAIRSICGREKVNCWLPLSVWRVMALFNDLFRRLPAGTTFNKLFSHQVFDSSHLRNWKVTISFENAIEKILSS